MEYHKEICKFFNKGECKYGENCRFAHIAGAANVMDNHPNNTAAGVCRFYQQGRCLRGQSCLYLHIPDVSDPRSRNSSSSTGLISPVSVPPRSPLQELVPPVMRSVSENTTLCKYFQKGLCARGEKCFYTHASPSDVAESRRSSSDSATSLTPDTRDSCMFFKLGRCLKGATCPFAHVNDAPADAGNNNNVVDCGKPIYITGFRDQVKSRALELQVAIRWPDVTQPEDDGGRRKEIQLVGADENVSGLKEFINTVLSEGVVRKEWEARQTGLLRVFQPHGDGLEWVNKVLQKKYDAVINVARGGSVEGDEGGGGDASMKEVAHRAKVGLSDSLCITYHTGDLLDYKADVLLLAVAEDFTLPAPLTQLAHARELQGVSDGVGVNLVADGPVKVMLKVITSDRLSPYPHIILIHFLGSFNSQNESLAEKALRLVLTWSLSYVREHSAHSLLLTPLLSESELPADVLCQCLVSETEAVAKAQDSQGSQAGLREVMLVGEEDRIAEEMDTWQNIMGPSPNKDDKLAVAQDKVTFTLLAMDLGNISSAIQDLKTYIQKHITKREFKNKAISQDTCQPSMLEMFEKKYHVSLMLQPLEEAMSCEGFVDDVLKFSFDFNKLLSKMSYAKVQTENEVQWMYEGGTGWLKFPMLTSYDIEESYVGKKSRIITNSKECGIYSVNFKNMMARLIDSSMEVHVQRISLSRDNLPLDWCPMSSDTPMELVPLQPTDVEYEREMAAFLKSVRSEVSVIAIERVQNPRLYTQYCVQLAHVRMRDKTSSLDSSLEKVLYHGTSYDDIHSINMGGFNRSFAGENATMYGHGTYFSVEAEYSVASNSYCPAHNGLRYIYVCQVISGQATKGSSHMNYPPLIEGNSNDRYDSLVDNIEDPKIYVIFNDNSAYPKYLITFK